MNNFKSSKYNIIEKMKSGQYLIYNTLSSCIAILSKEEAEILQKGVIENDNFADECLKMGFVVGEEEDELQKVIALRNMNNFNMNRAGFQILPTTGCNAKCFYCYEQDYISENMSEETIIQTIAFIKNAALSIKQLSIAWFGGEPLLRYDVIERMSKELIEFCDQNNIEYSSNMITNAILLSDDIISNLKKYRIESIQITIDGYREEHDRRKRYSVSNASYDQIIKTIGKLVRSEIKVLVRLNIDKDNFSGCLKAVEDLKQECGVNEYIWPYLAPLYSDKGNKACFKAEELADAFKIGYRKLIDCGYIQTVNGLPMNFTNASCCATMINNYVISPSGVIYKCEHLIGDNTDVVGNVKDGIIFNKAMCEWTDVCLPSECVECSYLPLCQAGCKAAVKRGFGYGRCSYIKYTTDATVVAAEYLLYR